MPSDVSSADHEQFYSLIQARTGLKLSDNQREDVARLAQTTLDSKTARRNDDLLRLLDQEPLSHPLWEEFIKIITVGETYFFRNADQFNALRTEILPALIDQRRRSGRKELRLWSAGCATGEEPYSLAMLLVELIPDLSSWAITLLATDLNVGNLDKARKGLYRTWSFRNETPPDVRERWFTTTPDGFQLSAAIQRLVQFAPLNLVSDDYPNVMNGTINMDMILCRNVTIYFDQSTTQEVSRRFHAALAPDGWLVVGHAEPVASVYQDFVPRNFPNAVIYQKNGKPVAPEVQAPPPTPVALAPLPKAKPAHTPAPRPVQPAPLKKPVAPVSPAPVDYLQAAKNAADHEKWDEAMQWLVQAERENKFQPHIYYLRALVQLHHDDIRGALASLRKALYCDPKFALAHYTLGEMHEKSGDYKMAAFHWRQAQATISGLAPDDMLGFADELTAEMLQGLLLHRIGALPFKTEEE